MPVLISKFLLGTETGRQKGQETGVLGSSTFT